MQCGHISKFPKEFKEFLRIKVEAFIFPPNFHQVNMAGKQEAWKNFKLAMKEKRVGKKQEKIKESKESKEEIVVQRLSSEVSGKAQKYLRIGPREFVHVGKEELTFESIQKACLKHFASKLGPRMYCDILAGEQGPSCSTLKQIPDMKLIHIRFTENNDHISEREDEKLGESSKHVVVSSLPDKRKCNERPHSLPSPAKKKVATVVPKSLSVTKMLMLGKVVDKPSTLINLYRFDIDKMLWSMIPKPVEFDISKDVLGEGGFRNAYKAQSTTPEFSSSTWVVKKYKPEALLTINQTGRGVETHSKKVVQMHCLAQNFARQLKSTVEEEGLTPLFGETMQYGDIYLGKESDEHVTIEEYVDGSFVKYINNDGIVCPCHDTGMLEKAECLTHFSFEKSNKELLLVDIQGCGHRLFDPEIASSTLFDEWSEILFTAGNLSKEAITNFTRSHKCNTFCTLIGLKKL
jgi:hypothetical protein